MSKKKLTVVDSLSVSSPCSVDDFEVSADKLGNDWFCNHCEQRVFNLSAMSRKEIAKLIESTGGNFCASIARRVDGTLVTADATDPSRAFLAAGALLASTALLSGVAVAEETLGKVVIDTASPTPEATPAPTATPTVGEKEACEKPPPSESNGTAPVYPPRERGKIAVKR